VARSAVSEKIVLCPTKCVVASYLVQLREDWSKGLARVQFLRRCWILGVHVHHEMRVWHKERHLTFRITTIGAVCVGLDELPDSKAIRGFVGGDGNVFAHKLVSVPPDSGPSFGSVVLNKTALSVNQGWMLQPIEQRQRNAALPRF
jgi:hypothetical protein